MTMKCHPRLHSMDSSRSNLRPNWMFCESVGNPEEDYCLRCHRQYHLRAIIHNSSDATSRTSSDITNHSNFSATNASPSVPLMSAISPLVHCPVSVSGHLPPPLRALLRLPLPPPPRVLMVPPLTIERPPVLVDCRDDLTDKFLRRCNLDLGGLEECKTKLPTLRKMLF